MKRGLIFFLLISIITTVSAQSICDHIECKCSHSYINSILIRDDYISSPLLSNYDVKFYSLDINLERDTVFIEGKVEIFAEVMVIGMDTCAFDLIKDMVIDSVFINSKSQSFTHTSDLVIVALSDILNIGEHFMASIYYHGSPPTGAYFSGLNSKEVPDWETSVTWTFSEPFNARQWWPCKQDLKDKADSANIFITTSAENMAGSNGLLTSVVPLANNKKRFNPE